MSSTPTNEPKAWTVTVEEDPETGELLLPLPVDLLAQMGWSEDTDLWWNINENNQVFITNVSKDKNEENTDNGSPGLGKNHSSE